MFIKNYYQVGGNMDDKPYQITYMKGPLNITLRLDKRENLVPELETTLAEARLSKVLNAKEEVSQPQASKPDVMEGQKCDKCGAKMVLSKKGNYYCEKKCWLN